MSNRPILVTGATGDTGREAVRRLLDPSEIRALDFKGQFRRSAICSVSGTIGIDWSILDVLTRSVAICIAGKIPSGATSVLIG